MVMIVDEAAGPAALAASVLALTAKAEAVVCVAPVHQTANVVYVAGSEHSVEAVLLAQPLLDWGAPCWWSPEAQPQPPPRP